MLYCKLHVLWCYKDAKYFVNFWSLLHLTLTWYRWSIWPIMSIALLPSHSCHCCFLSKLWFRLHRVHYTGELNKDTEFFDSDRIWVITTSNAMTRQIFWLFKNIINKLTHLKTVKDSEIPHLFQQAREWLELHVLHGRLGIVFGWPIQPLQALPVLIL